MLTKKNTINLVEYAGDVYFDYSTSLNKINITKMLGGKENIKKSKSKYSNPIGSAFWITEVKIIDIEKAKQAILANNFNYKITKDVVKT